MKKNSFRIDCRHLLGWMTCAMLTATIVACSDDPGLNGNTGGEIESGWIEGNVDPNQSWATAVSVQLDIETDHEADVTAQTILNQNVTILGQKHIKESNVMFVDVPQGIGTSFGLVYDDGSQVKQYKRIDLSGKSTQVVDVDFRGVSTNAVAAQTRAASRAATSQSLYGYSYIPDCGYLNFGSWVWDAIASAVPEATNASKNYASMIDYEMKADGSIMPGGEFESQEILYLSFIYGFTGQYNSRTLGYYYYTPGTTGSYSDIVFQDIAELLTKDYLNGKAKVQYQLDGIDTWYDANFDYKDADGLPLPSGSGDNDKTTTSQTARQGDDAYNVYKVNKAYGNRISAVRGLTFKLEIPQGKTFGFYLRSNDAITNNQKAILRGKGIPEEKLPKYKMNFSNASLNASTNTTYFRSSMAIFDNFTFMGIDDNLDNGGDLDCNDITFTLSNAKGEKFIPTFTEETLNSDYNKNTIAQHPEYKNPSESNNGENGSSNTNLQSWTVAMENGGTDIDFDFNDVVLKITPNTSTKKCAISLLAAGAMRKTELYYDNKLLGEVHDLFKVSIGTMVNTEGDVATIAPVDLGEVDWTEDNINKNLGKFTLKVYEGDKELRTVYYNEKIGVFKNIPQGVCISGDWAWPKEGKNLNAVYTLLKGWATNISDPSIWNWYSQPKHDLIVQPKK